MNMLKAYWTRMSKAQPIQATSQKGWEARQASLRKEVLAGFGLEPLPPRVPLNLTCSPGIERDDCTISRVYFQTFPGIYATGFLYMPKKVEFPAPAVLHPHGHWANGAANDAIVESRCIGLAHRGYVSLVIQMQHFEDLATGVPMRGVALWNNMRGLDVLESLPQVDNTRIGVTGASGGGMQSTDIAALDPRIKCAVIVAYPTYFYKTGYIHAWPCMCNFGPINAMRFMDQQSLIAMIAPRPAAVFTLTGDWTNDSIDHELKEVAGVYDLFTAEPGPKLENVEAQQPYRLRTSADGRFLGERWDGPHDYTKAMRERMYWWMDWWLKGKRDPTPAPEENLNLDPSSKQEALRADVPNARDWTFPNLASAIRAWRKYQLPTLKTRGDVDAYRPKLRAALRDLLNEPVAETPKTVESTSLGTETIGDWMVEKLWYVSEPDVHIPALLIKPTGETSVVKQMAVLVSANGKNDVFVEPLRSLCQALLKEGRAVLAIDQRLRGEWAYQVSPPGQAPAVIWQGNARWWGRPELGMAVHDISMSISFLATRKDCSLESLRLVGSGHTAGYAALLAAGLDERVKECVADLNHSNFAEGLTDPPTHATAPAYTRRPPILAGVLRYGDVGEFAALVAPRKLELFNLDSRTSLQTAEAAYRLLGAGGQLRKVHDVEAPVKNGGFEEGTAGWQCENGAVPTLTTERAAAGKASLQLAPSQTVISQPVAVEPMMAYRLAMSVFKPQRTSLVISLERDGKRVPLANDYFDRASFQDVEHYFIARPGETSIRIVLSASAYKVEDGLLLGVDSVRVVEDHPMEVLKPDERELLTVTSVEKLDVGTTITNQSKGTFVLFYGPGNENKVVAEGKDGRRALYAKPKPGTYVGFMAPKTELLKPGRLYRFEVTARGKGILELCFVGIYLCASPRMPRTELTDDWKTYSVDFFVETDAQRDGLPTVQLSTGEFWLDRVSLKEVDPAAAQAGGTTK
ncbi:MAG: alpha/beta hydrolase family protein [Armatimonadota bacterium]